MIALPNYECPFRLGDTVIPIEPAEDEVNRPPFWVDERDVIRNGTQVRLTISEDGYPWLWHTSWISPVIEYTLF